MDDTDIVRMASSIVWLEDQQQNAQNLLTKLQQQVDQLGAFAKEHGLMLRGQGHDLDRVKSQLSRLPGLEDSAHQLQEQIAKLHDEQAASLSHLERLDRGQQADSKRLGQAMVEIRQLFEPLSSEVESLPSKLSLVAEGLKRQQDALAQLYRDVELQTTEQRSQSGRLQGALDQLRRAEQDILRLAGELEPLRHQDDALLARIQGLGEQIKQIADQSTFCMELDELYRDLLDRSQLQKAEHQSLESQVASVAQTLSEQGGRLEDIVRTMKAAEDKTRLAAEALTSLQNETGDRWQRVLQMIGDHQQLIQGHKEREVAELERQMRELKERAIWREET